MKIISQHVDTLKFHYYINENMEIETLSKYNQLIESYIREKKSLQQDSNDYTGVSHLITLGGVKFALTPQGIKGFSVVLNNKDLTIALKKSPKLHNPNPVIKIEFRAEFLARVGYIKAIEYANDLVKRCLITDYRIIVSEIHLATDIQGYDFTILDYFRFKKRTRISDLHEEYTDEGKSQIYGGLTTFTGFTFGGGNYHLRIYNKTEEVKKYPEKRFAQTHYWDYSEDYKPNMTVWRIEIQYRRAKLKELQIKDGIRLDGYENVLNNIPSLWSKVIKDFKLMDFDDMQAFDLLRRKKTLKDGREKVLTKNSIYGIFKRAEILKEWLKLDIWNNHDIKRVVMAFRVPVGGSLNYVSNSIKSLFSTMGKYYGHIDRETFIRAFSDSNKMELDRKKISLIDGAINKALDYFEKVEYCKIHGDLSVPAIKDFQLNLYKSVLESSDIFYADDITKKTKDRYNATKSQDTISIV